MGINKKEIAIVFVFLYETNQEDELKKFSIVNFVPRTSLKWDLALENNIKLSKSISKKEIFNIKKRQRNER